MIQWKTACSLCVVIYSYIHNNKRNQTLMYLHSFETYFQISSGRASKGGKINNSNQEKFHKRIRCMVVLH